MASIASIPVRERAIHSAVAPWWHTVGMFLLFIVLAALTATAQHAMPAAGAAPSPFTLYLPLLVIEGLLLWYVRWGLARREISLRSLIGGTWSGRRDVLRDVGIAAAMWALWMGISTLWTRLSPSAEANVNVLLPHGALGSSLWVAVSLTAGLVEEILFRGYFQRQFAAWSGSGAIGLIIQAVLFGLAHGYQGLSACVRIVGYGLLFGCVALWRRSLRPGIVAHAWTDIASGLFLA